MQRDISVTELVPNDYNPNEMTEEEFGECKAEIQHLGNIPKPIVVRPLNGKFVIVDGEHNWRAATELGLATVPCEVLELDDTEAMRQTYKRNLHGKFNPIKLGQMFERVSKVTGLSQRALAEQYEVSEGTIRNALLYSQAAALRNSYAFDKLSVRQVRLYTSLPPGIRDKWLDAGADPKLLLTKKDIRWWEKYLGAKWSDSSFDTVETECDSGGINFLKRLNDIYEDGLAEMVKGTKGDFQKSVAQTLDFAGWEYWSFHHGDKELKDRVRQYSRHYYKYYATSPLDKSLTKSVRDAFRRVFRLIYYQGQFRVTPEEFERIFNEAMRAGCEEGYEWKYPRHEYVEKAVQLLLIQKGVLTEPVNVNDLPDPGDKIAELQLAQSAPDYLKLADIPANIKVHIHGFVETTNPFDRDQPVPSEIIENAKREMIKEIEGANRVWKAEHEYVPFELKAEDVKQSIHKKVVEALRKQRDDAMTKEDMADKIISFTRLYTKPEEAHLRETFKGNLSALEREELLNIFYVMDYENYLRDMRTFLKRLEDY